MKKLKRFLSIILCLFVIVGAGCVEIFSKEEIIDIKETFASFNNSSDFALEHFDNMWLADKEIDFKELSYNGKKIDRLFGCSDGHCYVSIRTKVNKSYTIYFLEVDYDSFEMKEVGSVCNLKQSYTPACRFVDGKLYFTDNHEWCVYDLKTGNSEWREYNHDAFWKKESSKYLFKITNNKSDSVVEITDKETNEKKKISWKDDLTKFEEGLYIRQIENRSKLVNSEFVDVIERDGLCYILGLIPFDNLVVQHQAVIFVYDYKNEDLNYYSSIPYNRYELPTLTIIKR